VVCQDGQLELSLFESSGDFGTWVGMVDAQLLPNAENLRLELLTVLAEIVEQPSKPTQFGKWNLPICKQP